MKQQSIGFDSETKLLLTRMAKRGRISESDVVRQAIWEQGEVKGFAANGKLIEDWSEHNGKQVSPRAGN